jgi:hypothetical protein
MLHKRIIGAVTALLAVVATLAVAAPANARTVGMRCDKFGYYSTGNVNYTPSGSQDNIYSYDWVIHGEANSRQNDVSVTLYHVVWGPDDALNGFASGTERNGYGAHGVNLSYPTSWALYGAFYFSFDVNNLPDPACGGETTQF